MIAYVEFGLPVGWEIAAAVAADRHVGVPLDIVDAGILGHQVVDDAEYEVLDGGITEVENDLGAATSLDDITAGGIDDPVGMLLVKLGDSIGHLGLDPYAETYAVLAGGLHETSYAVGQFVPVHDPVAERTVVAQSRIFVAEPAVVHDEEFAAHRSNVGHHLVHSGFVDIEIDSFPAVEQDLAFTVAVGDLVGARPAVEIARDSAEAFVGEGQREFRSAEGLPFRESQFTVVRKDTGEKAVVISIVCDEIEMIVSAVAECGPDDRAGILLGLAIERYHHLGVGRMRITDTVLIVDAERPALERLLHEASFIGPGAIKMAYPDISDTDGQEGGIELAQDNGLLLSVDDLRPGLDHIDIRESLVEDLHAEIIDLVLQGYAGGLRVLCRFRGNGLDGHVKGHIPV